MSELHVEVVAPPTADRLLLLAHGFGADERDLAGLIPYLDPEGSHVVVLPRGPLAVPGTPGYAWYTWGPDGAPDLERFAASLADLDALLDAACGEHGVDRSGAIVGGFSQGAGLALALGLLAHRTAPRGVLALSPALPGPPLPVPVDDEAITGLPVLIEHGSEDPIVGVDRARALARDLEARRVPITYVEFPMGHGVAMEGLGVARGWLTAVEAGETPSMPVPADPPEGPVKRVTSATFAAEVLQSPLPVIVDFWAPWCQPCRQVSPIVEQIAVMREGAYKVVKINIDEEPALAEQFGIQSIPLIALFRNGRLERMSQGAKPRPHIEGDLGMLVIP
ncbi:MAG: thioredoxin domain-containing protein [Actinomycetes bacterium]